MRYPSESAAAAIGALWTCAALAQPLPAGMIIGFGQAGGTLPTEPGPFVRMSVGPTNTLGMREDGSLVGSFYGGTPPPGAFIDFSAGGGEYDSCGFGIRPDGSAVHWGSGPPFLGTPLPGPFVRVSAGSGWGAILIRADGTLVSWGLCGGCYTNLPPGQFIDADAGASAGVGVRADGTLAAWGSKASGLLNPPPGTFTSVSVGSNFAVAIRTEGTLAAWGANSGMLNVPAGTFKAVEAAYPQLPEWAIGLRTDGTLVAWGNAAPELPQVPARFVGIGASTFYFGAALTGCYADCNDDAALTIADFACFQTQFVAGCR